MKKKKIGRLAKLMTLTLFEKTLRSFCSLLLTLLPACPPPLLGSASASLTLS